MISSVLVLSLVHCSVTFGTWHVRLLRSTPLLCWCTTNLSHCCIFLACCCVATAHLVDSTCCLLLLHHLRYIPLLLFAPSQFLGLCYIHPSIMLSVHINGRGINYGTRRRVCGFRVPMMNIHINGEFLIVAINHWHKGVFGWYWEISAMFLASRKLLSVKCMVYTIH